jgi:DNA repair exonuclease SbcCD nuclease subunit
MAADGERAIVLVHSSDLHVDDDLTPGRYNGLLGLRTVLATAQALAADVVLLAGDTFDNARISLPILQEAAALLAGAAMPVVVLPGNHDPAMPECLFRRAGIIGLPDVHVLGITHRDVIAFDAHRLEICGLAHRGFGDMAPLRAPWPRRARWQVVMAHGHYVPPGEWDAQSHRAWKISDQALADTQADYIALGHWDRPTPVGDGRVPAFYSGSPDLAGTVNVIRLAGGAGAVVERVPLHWPA